MQNFFLFVHIFFGNLSQYVYLKFFEILNKDIDFQDYWSFLLFLEIKHIKKH